MNLLKDKEVAAMKIGIVLPNLHWHGGSQVGVTLAEAMAQAGHEVELFVIDPAWKPMAARPRPSVPTTFLSATSLPSAVKRLRGRLAERNLDVVHAVGDSASMILGLSVRKLPSRPERVIGSEHFPISAKFGDFKHFKGRIAERLMKHAYGSLDASICVNNDLQERMVKELGWERGRSPVIHNPVRLPIADPIEIELQREQRRSSASDFVIVAAGALQQRKDWPTLLRAFAIASKSVPVRLKIAGEGGELAALQRLSAELGVSSQVEFVGQVDEMENFLHRGDLFAFSSTMEALPLVLIEALSQGLMIVSTDCNSGPSELIEDQVHGRLVPVGDHEKMAEAIIEVINQPPSAATLISRAKDFHPTNVTKQYLKFFKGESANGYFQSRDTIQNPCHLDGSKCPKTCN